VASSNLKDSKMGRELLDILSRMHIIEYTVNPYPDLVPAADRSLKIEQRLASETQTNRFRSLTSRC